MIYDVKVSAFKNTIGKDYNFKQSTTCEVSEDIDDTELIELMFNNTDTYFINKKDLLKAINIISNK